MCVGLGFKRGDMLNFNPTLQVLASSYPYQIPKVHIYSTSLFFFLSLFLLLILPYPVSLSPLPFFFFFTFLLIISFFFFLWVSFLFFVCTLFIYWSWVLVYFIVCGIQVVKLEILLFPICMWSLRSALCLLRSLTSHDFKIWKLAVIC